MSSRVHAPSLFLVAAAALLAAAPLHGQQTAPPDSLPTPPAANAHRPRVGVVLSGGSAKGLAHIGVLRVLEEAGVPVDVITGTSMGGLVGSLYAIGYSAGGLEHIATTLDWPYYFQDAPQGELVGVDQRLLGPRTLISFPIEDGRITLPSGVVAGQRVSDLLARLTWPVQTERDFRRFPIPFAAVATDLATRDAVVMDSGSLAENLRASMSLPGLFTPVEVNGRLLTDGGIVRNLPAQEARAMGADVLICSDVSSTLAAAADLQSLVDVLMQTITFQIHASTMEQRKLCDIYIRPDVEGLEGLTFDRAAVWMERGAAATRAVLPELRAMGVRARVPRPPDWSGWTSPPTYPVHVREVVVRDLSAPAERAVRRALRLAPPTWVTPDGLEHAMERVYATQLFERVIYRLDAVMPGAADTLPPGSDSAAARAVRMVIEATVADQDKLGFGFRFDDHYKASLLFNATLRNRLGFGSTTQVEARLGEQLRLGAEYLRAGMFDSHLVIGGSAAFIRTPIEIFSENQPVAEANVEVTSFASLLGATLGTNGFAGVQLKGEHSNETTSISPVDTSTSHTFYSVAAVGWRESFDRRAFPSRGAALFAKAEHAGGEARFTHYVANARVVVALSDVVSLIGRGTVGAAFGGSEVPLHYRFFLGGVYTSPLFAETQISLAGFRPQQRSGAAVARMSGAVQWQVRRSVFTTFRLDAGQAAERFGDALGDLAVGGALSLGAATPFGPVELSASGRTLGEPPRLELNVGFVF